MGKKSLIVVFVFVVFLSTAVYSAGTPSFSVVPSVNCVQDRTIFKISSLDNAHAALWNDNAYQYSVCYDAETVPANSHQCMSSMDSLNFVGNLFGVEVSSSDVQDFVGVFGEDFSINNFLGLSSATNAHAEARLSSSSDAIVDNYANNVCYGGLFCAASEGLCRTGVCAAKLSSATNAHVASCSNTDYPISICCVDLGSLTSDILDDAAPQTCSVNSGCAEGAVCGESGVCTIPPGDGEVPSGGTTCTTTSQCEENEACFLDAGTGGYCDVCDPESTANIDGDEFLDCSGEDPCVGSSDAGCFEDDIGLSCNDLDGIVCGANEVCSSTSETSNQATELNCCVAEIGNPGCESASIYFSELRTSVVLQKSCTSDGKTHVTIVRSGSDRSDPISSDELALMGFDPSKGSSYIDTTDYSCSNINLGASTTGADVPGYGLISVLLSLFIILAFYANRKILKF